MLVLIYENLKKLMAKHCNIFLKSTVVLIVLMSFGISVCEAQKLRLKPRSNSALGGNAFAKMISDSTLTLERREDLIYQEIKKGNVPPFLRKFTPIHQKLNDSLAITYFSLPDYFAIGSNDDFFYIPMTPILAQRVAYLLHCSLPTKKIVDTLYQRAEIKLVPQPIPPTRAMTTVPVFIAHSAVISRQLAPYSHGHTNGVLTAGHKKDLIISNKIYTEKTAKVVIYGWHQPNGKPIQPVYNKHTNLWADYSHGVRFISEKVMLINGSKESKSSVAKVLSGDLHYLLSDEGAIKNPVYPITSYQ